MPGRDHSFIDPRRDLLEDDMKRHYISLWIPNCPNRRLKPKRNVPVGLRFWGSNKSAV